MNQNLVLSCLGCCTSKSVKITLCFRMHSWYKEMHQLVLRKSLTSNCLMWKIYIFHYLFKNNEVLPECGQLDIFSYVLWLVSQMLKIIQHSPGFLAKWKKPKDTLKHKFHHASKILHVILLNQQPLEKAWSKIGN